MKYFIARKMSDGTYWVAKNHAYDTVKTARLNGKIFFGNARDWIILEGTENGIPWPCDWPATGSSKKEG